MKHFQFGVLLPEHTATYLFDDDGTFPNNDHLPVVIYEHAAQVSNEDIAEEDIKKLLAENNWGGTWRGGVLDVHHYHSTAHEILGILTGTITLLLGGPSGKLVHLKQGDVVIIPAGVAHKCEEASGDFECVGAYPNGQHYDMNYGKEGERDTTLDNIKHLPLPEKDPIYGAGGPLSFHWRGEVYQKA